MEKNLVVLENFLKTLTIAFYKVTHNVFIHNRNKLLIKGFECFVYGSVDRHV